MMNGLHDETKDSITPSCYLNAHTTFTTTTIITTTTTITTMHINSD